MIIYKTTNLINGKIYVGKDSKSNPNYLGSGLLLKRAINKYGVENFKKETIEECSSLEELSIREKFWIKELDSINNDIGYNLTEGGTGGDTWSNTTDDRKNERSIKISETGKGRKVSNNVKEKMSKSRNEYFKKTGGYSQEIKDKIRNTLFDKNLPDEDMQYKIIEKYKDPKNFICDILSEYNLTIKLFYYILGINEVNIVKRKSYQYKEYDNSTIENVCNSYINDALSFRKISEMYSIGIVVVKRILSENSVKFRDPGFKKGVKKSDDVINSVRKSRGTYLSND